MDGLLCSSCEENALIHRHYCANCGKPLLRSCPKCQTLNRYQAHFCTNCGSKFSTLSHKPNNESTPSFLCSICDGHTLIAMRFCVNCGTPLLKSCQHCQTLNRVQARFCIRCGAELKTVLQQDPTPETHNQAVSTDSSAASLHLLTAAIYPGFGRSRVEDEAPPVERLHSSDTAFHIRLRFQNLDITRQHSHRLFAHYFRPNGRLHKSRERVELLVATQGGNEVETRLFGLRIAGSDAINHPGLWRAVVYLDEDRICELPFAIVT